ncbi:putative Rossmann fold nucleotide-binding protein DprA/Smf involved in DNA uptake [Pseudomonas sp. 478]|uniref:DNA-processing protein DprA n=1 Tax=unclassified Pseudomonas TaxID=196821 RepID=UPI000DAE1178|nr:MULTISPECIES: DNA-processing protein DprA [unclassified Pseudomonas]PZW99341.1 putative Rossmann fold nucleotide-binding protein DprA/Smf involved in DNA uptake [Pseudomonas sp. 478]TCV49117.1 putative Rossmann fold nucleotide-binding protein DprA/Smf involved in DNA uptake [Pseudomonas sp. 460]
MNTEVSINTKAVLLLTAPLLVGKEAAVTKVLAPREYKKLAHYLHGIKRQPSDLLYSDSSELIRACGNLFIEEGRIEKLLNRAFLLSQVIDRWQSLGIWVLSRADPQYPRRLKLKMKSDAPPILYGCGDVKLLDMGGVAVVGSRKVEQDLIDYAASVGKLAAQSNRMVISGGAKGVDRAAMQGCLDLGGVVCEVLAEHLESAALKRSNRDFLISGNLVLVSAYDPSAGFSVGHAMQRNKLIYALSDASLVVNSDLNKGGTWAGAIEQLDKLNYVPVFVRSSGTYSDGVEALQRRGAIPWPNPKNKEEFLDVFDASFTQLRNGISELDLLGKMVDAGEVAAEQNLPENFQQGIQEAESGGVSRIDEHNKNRSVGFGNEDFKSVALKVDVKNTAEDPSDILFSVVRELIFEVLKSPMKDVEIASVLGVSVTQARTWLHYLIDEGVVVKQKKVATYILKPKPLF